MCVCVLVVSSPLLTAWDHRGATSDVGVGMLHDSPESRETVSEVGTGYKPHHVFKQV